MYTICPTSCAIIIFIFACFVAGNKSTHPQMTNATHPTMPQTVTIRLITWFKNRPYYVEDTQSNKPVEERGIVPAIMFTENLLPRCQQINRFNLIDESSDHLQSHTQLYKMISDTKNATVVMKRMKVTENSTDIVVVSATSALVDTQHSIFKRRLVVSSQSLSVLVPTTQVTLLKKFYNGIKDCYDIMLLAVFICVAMASVTWFIEYLARNPDIPKTFGKGLCVSFWCCFATMTTIGYSKKTQKHFITKLLIIVWLMFELLLTGMITATMMTSIEKQVPISGKEIAVITSSEEKHQVSKLLSGTPKEYATHSQIIAALLNGSVSAALIETNTAAVLVNKRQKDVFIQEQIRHETKIYAYVYIPYVFEHCHDNMDIEENTIIVQEREDQVRAKFVPPFQVTMYYQAQKFLEIFDASHTKGIMFYLGVTTASIVAMALFSEIIAKLCAKRIARDDDDHFKSSPKYKRIRALEKTFQTIIANMLAEELKYYDVKETKNPSYFVMSNGKTKM